MRAGRLSTLLAPIRLRYLFLTVVTLGLIFFGLTYLGISKARQSLLKIMVDEGRALVESLTLSSNNAIQAELLLESLTEEKLAEVAALAADQLTGRPGAATYNRLCQEYDLLSLDVLDDSLLVYGSSRWISGIYPEYPANVRAEIIELLRQGAGYRSVITYDTVTGPKTTQYFIYRLPESESGGQNGLLMVMAADAAFADQILEQIGIGYLIRRISGQGGIEYIFLQGREGIVFSSRSLPPVLSIDSDPFLDSLMQTDSAAWRIHQFDGEEVLEIARRFESVTYPPGIYRLGLNMAGYHELSKGYDLRLIITAVVVFLLTLAVVAVVSLNQNYFILDRSYRQMQSRTEIIFNQLADGALAVNVDRRIIAANEAFGRLTGIGPAAIDRSLDDIASQLPPPILRAIEERQTMAVQELVVSTPTGQSRTVLAGLSPLPETAGGGTLLLMHDITDQRLLEREVRRRERLSEMGDMAAGVAHEIRNPLNAIGIAAQRLKAEFTPLADGDEYNQLAGNILRETERLNNILTRFLELARSRAGESRPVSLNEIITAAAASLQDEARYGGIEITVDMDENITLRGDRDRLQQMFINLIKNGIQAIGQSGRISIKATPRDGEVLISVSDTGPGFTNEALAKLFQPYFTTKASGSGLGLALIYKTVIDSGGIVEAGNLPGGGAEIKITLPIIR